MKIVTLVALSSIMGTPALSDWKTGFGQGLLELRVDNGPGNSFTIVCDEGFSASGSNKITGLNLSVVGKDPPTNSTIEIFVDGDRFEAYADGRGIVRTDSRVASDNFAEMWRSLRRSRLLLVRYSNGLSASFKTAGASKALSRRHCTTGFES